MNNVGTAAGTITMQLPDGRVVALADWIDDKIYATIQLSHGQVTQVLAFSTGQTQIIPNGSRPATEVDTNTPRNGDSGLPKDYELVCYGWGIEFTRATRPDQGLTIIDSLNTYSNSVRLDTFLSIDRKLFFQYRYNNRNVAEGRISDFPTGHGPYLVTEFANTEFVNNGVPSPRDRVSLVLPVHHKENLTFKGIFQPVIALTWGPTGQGGTGSAVGQLAADGVTPNLLFVDVRLIDYGLVRRAVPA